MTLFKKIIYVLLTPYNTNVIIFIFSNWINILLFWYDKCKTYLLTTKVDTLNAI